MGYHASAPSFPSSHFIQATIIHASLAASHAATPLPNAAIASTHNGSVALRCARKTFCTICICLAMPSASQTRFTARARFLHFTLNNLPFRASEALSRAAKAFSRQTAAEARPNGTKSRFISTSSGSFAIVANTSVVAFHATSSASCASAVNSHAAASSTSADHLFKVSVNSLVNVSTNCIFIGLPPFV